MADIQQVWQSEDGWKVLGLRYYVHQDFDHQPNLEAAFDLVVSARVLGAQIGQAVVGPLKNTNPLTLQLAAGVAGSISGRLDDWHGVLPDGTTHAAWTAGGLGSARFVLTLDIDVIVPVLLKRVPVSVKAFHKPCTVLLHWDAKQKRYTHMPVA